MPQNQSFKFVAIIHSVEVKPQVQVLCLEQLGKTKSTANLDKLC